MIEAWIGNRKPQHYCDAMEVGEFMWVASTECPVGFASLHGAELNALYTTLQAPAGTGTALLKAVVAHARASGVAEVFASSSLNAVSFYAGRGFKELGPAPLIRSGLRIPAIRMRRRLGD